MFKTLPFPLAKKKKKDTSFPQSCFTIRMFLCLQFSTNTTTKMLNARGDKIVRNITMGTTVTAAYFLLRADYGPESNALDPIKNAILSAENHVKELVLGQSNNPQGNRVGSPSSANSKEQHP